MTWHPCSWYAVDPTRDLLLTVEEFLHQPDDASRYRFRLTRALSGRTLAESGPHGYATPQDAMEAAEAAARSERR